MAESIGDRFTQGRRRVQGIVTRSKRPHDASRDRQVVAKEALRALKEVERISDFLAIVQKLLLVCPQNRAVESALWIVRHQSVISGNRPRLRSAAAFSISQTVRSSCRFWCQDHPIATVELLHRRPEYLAAVKIPGVEPSAG